MSTIHKDWCASIRRSQDLPGSDPYPCDCEVDSKSKQVPDGTVSSPAHQEWLRRRSQQEPLNPVPNKEDLSRGTFACPICGIGTPHSFEAHAVDEEARRIEAINRIARQSEELGEYDKFVPPEGDA